MEKRGRFTPKEKVQILLESFSKEITVTDICKKYSIHPNMYYQWKKELFENAESIFSIKGVKLERKKNKKR